jgi:hypothetical protein
MLLPESVLECCMSCAAVGFPQRVYSVSVGVSACVHACSHCVVTWRACCASSFWTEVVKEEDVLLTMCFCTLQPAAGHEAACNAAGLDLLWPECLSGLHHPLACNVT